MRKSAPSTALLVIDFFNPLLAGRETHFVRDTRKAAHETAALKRRARRARWPVIYANDHFGNWRSDFPSLIHECRQRDGCAGEVVDVLEPGPRDFSVLKPRHSAFYGTPLEFLLDELGVRRLILTGIEADVCVMFTAHDAYMRKFAIWVPRNCVASRSDSSLTAALAFMRANLKADTRPSGPTIGPSLA